MMVRSGVLRVLAVALLTVSAGCAGFGGAPQTATLSPAPVPSTESPTPTPESTPVVPAEEDEGDTFVDEHVRILRNTSYQYTQIVEVDGPHSLNLSRHVSVGSNGDSLTHVRLNGTGVLQTSIRSAVTWDGEGRPVTQATSLSGYTGRLALPPVPPERGIAGSALLKSIVSSTTITSDVYLGSSTFAAFSTEPFELDYPGPLRTFENGRNAVAHMQIERSGLIRNLDLSFEATIADENVSVRIEQRVDNVGETEIEPPDWVDSNQTTSTE